MKTVILGGHDDGDVSKSIRAAVAAGEPVEVVTEFSSMSDVPKQLRDMFRLDAVASTSWVDSFTGRFVPGATVPTKMNLRAAIAAGGAATGAGVGAVAGGLVGAGVGAIVGVGVGAVIAVLTQDDVKVHIEIDARGKLIIKVEPK